LALAAVVVLVVAVAWLALAAQDLAQAAWPAALGPTQVTGVGTPHKVPPARAAAWPTKPA